MRWTPRRNRIIRSIRSTRSKRSMRSARNGVKLASGSSAVVSLTSSRSSMAEVPTSMASKMFHESAANSARPRPSSRTCTDRVQTE